jgi:hypothetical protein
MENGNAYGAGVDQSDYIDSASILLNVDSVGSTASCRSCGGGCYGCKGSKGAEASGEGSDANLKTLVENILDD